jgi:hypothetical protein
MFRNTSELDALLGSARTDASASVASEARVIVPPGYFHLMIAQAAHECGVIGQHGALASARLCPSLGLRTAKRS